MVRSEEGANLKHIVYLYNSRSDLSVQLLDRLRDITPGQGVDVWSDRDARDPGFDAELVREFWRSNAIVFAIAKEGLGRYQQKNELGRIVDALRSNYRRRLVLAYVGGDQDVPQLEIFDEFANRTDKIILADDAASVDGLIQAALPDLALGDAENDEDKLALQLVKRFKAGRHFVVVVGPYAFAEAEFPQATPATAIARFVRANDLEGAPPWIDVMGSIARSIVGDEGESTDAIVDALRGDDSCDQSGLGVYLRLIAANWIDTPGLGKMFIVSSMPDEWVDRALGSSNLPVPHLKMIHNAREPDPVELKRVVIDNGVSREVPCSADDAEATSAKVILVKPFGSVSTNEAATKAMLTSEQWRLGVQSMPIPSWAALDMTKSALLVLGAGAFTPNIQMLFRTLLPTALEQKSGNGYRYLIHNPQSCLDDPLHHIEAQIIKDRNLSRRFATWLYDQYQLNVEALNPVNLLVSIEHFLNRPT